MIIQTLKTFIRQPLLIIAFAVFSLLLLFHPYFSSNGKLISQSSVFQSQLVSKVFIGSPVRLKIPSIKVNAAIEYVGLTPKREMEVPKKTVDVGWFEPGPRPGEKGSAVIAGHFNGRNGEEGVFADLYKLKTGDKLYIESNIGTTTIFIVLESRTYDPGLAGNVFSRSDGIYLNLITCDGVWDGVKKSYSKRLVVFARAL